MSDNGFRLNRMSDFGMRTKPKPPHAPFKWSLPRSSSWPSSSSLSPSGPFINIYIFARYAHRFGEMWTRSCVHADDGPAPTTDSFCHHATREVAIAVRSREHVMTAKSPLHVSRARHRTDEKKDSHGPSSLTRLGSCLYDAANRASRRNVTNLGKKRDAARWLLKRGWWMAAGD
jgi:hypothetical protein